MIEHAHAVMCHLSNSGFGEQPECANYWHKAGGLLTDPAHITGELIFDGLETAVAFSIAWVLGRRALRREHARLDREHGVTHHEVDTRWVDHNGLPATDYSTGMGNVR